MKKVLCLVLAFLMVFSMVACAAEENTPAAEQENPAPETETPAEETAETSWKVGINNWGQANFFARVGKASMEDELAKLGCEVVATVSENASERMVAIENMIQQGCDAIIIEEGDVNEVATALQEAKDAGIVIGSMDAGTADFVDIYVSSDNVSLGATVAEEMVKATGGKGKLVEIVNVEGAMIRQRQEGFHSVLADYPEMEVIQTLPYNWPDYYNDMKMKIEAVLQANPNPGDIVGIFACFDGVGIAAYDAIKEAGLQDYITIVGVDGDPDAYEKMREENSNYVCTVAQDPETIARLTCQKVVDVLNGVELESKIEYVPGILITKDNIPEDQ